MPIPNQDPSQLSAAAKLMAERIALTQALMGGTEAMRAKGQAYLPQYEAESDKNYQYRLNRATLLNMFRRAVGTLVGKPFSKPIQTKDIPAQLQPLIEDVDRNGNHLGVFARAVFQDALVSGISHVLVEYPNVENQQPASLQDERALNAQPYLVHIPHCSIIAAYSTTVNGREQLAHVRILEEEVVREGFGEVTKTRVRVLEPGSWKLYEKQDKRWEIVEEGRMSLPYIPLLTYYADREDFMVALPPLTDLAYLNLAHWQSSSDQRNILTLSRFPLLAGRGLNEEEANVPIGPNKLLTSMSKDGVFYYVEHSGAAINAGRVDLEDLKSEMAIMAVDLLRPSGMVTATEKAIDTAQSTSVLQDMTLRFGDFLERCLGVAADWIGLSAQSYGSVQLNTDFGIIGLGADLDTLIKLRNDREISHEQFIAELIRRNVLGEDFDVKADRIKLEEEQDREIELSMMRNELLGLNPDGSPKEQVIPNA